MKILFSNPERNYTFDFTGKRVKQNGKAITKIEISYILERSSNRWVGLSIWCAESIYSYDECKTILLQTLEKDKYENVKIIK